MCVKTVCVCIYVYTYASVELVGQVVKVLDCQPLGCRFKSSPVPTRPPSCNGYLEYSGVQVHLTLSRASTMVQVMVQVGLRVSTPFAERRSLASS